MTRPPKRSRDPAVELPVAVIDAASAARRRTFERPAVVAVDGPAGSGKTTIADRLAGVLGDGERPAPVVHMDDLYPGWDGLAAAVPLLVDQVLAPLATGAVPRWRRYDWEAGRYAEEHRLPPTPTAVVVEGVACGSLPCAPYLALLVWVDAPHDLRLSRGVARDGETFRPHWERWAAQERAHFTAHRTRERADLRLSTATGVPELIR